LLLLGLIIALVFAQECKKWRPLGVKNPASSGGFTLTPYLRGAAIGFKFDGEFTDGGVPMFSWIPHDSRTSPSLPHGEEANTFTSLSPNNSPFSTTFVTWDNFCNDKLNATKAFGSNQNFKWNKCNANSPCTFEGVYEEKSFYYYKNLKYNGKHICIESDVPNGKELRCVAYLSINLPYGNNEQDRYGVQVQKVYLNMIFLYNVDFRAPINIIKQTEIIMEVVKPENFLKIEGFLTVKEGWYLDSCAVKPGTQPFPFKQDKFDKTTYPVYYHSMSSTEVREIYTGNLEYECIARECVGEACKEPVIVPLTYIANGIRNRETIVYARFKPQIAQYSGDAKNYFKFKRDIAGSGDTHVGIVATSGSDSTGWVARFSDITFTIKGDTYAYMKDDQIINERDIGGILGLDVVNDYKRTFEHSLERLEKSIGIAVLLERIRVYTTGIDISGSIKYQYTGIAASDYTVSNTTSFAFSMKGSSEPSGGVDIQKPKDSNILHFVLFGSLTAFSILSIFVALVVLVVVLFIRRKKEPQSVVKYDF